MAVLLAEMTLPELLKDLVARSRRSQNDYAAQASLGADYGLDGDYATPDSWLARKTIAPRNDFMR